MTRRRSRHAPRWMPWPPGGRPSPVDGGKVVWFELALRLTHSASCSISVIEPSVNRYVRRCRSRAGSCRRSHSKQHRGVFLLLVTVMLEDRGELGVAGGVGALVVPVRRFELLLHRHDRPVEVDHRRVRGRLRARGARRLRSPWRGCARREVRRNPASRSAGRGRGQARRDGPASTRARPSRRRRSLVVVACPEYVWYSHRVAQRARLLDVPVGEDLVDDVVGQALVHEHRHGRPGALPALSAAKSSGNGGTSAGFRAITWSTGCLNASSTAP